MPFDASVFGDDLQLYGAGKGFVPGKNEVVLLYDALELISQEFESIVANIKFEHEQQPWEYSDSVYKQAWDELSARGDVRISGRHVAYSEVSEELLSEQTLTVKGIILPSSADVSEQHSNLLQCYIGNADDIEKIRSDDRLVSADPDTVYFGLYSLGDANDSQCLMNVYNYNKFTSLRAAAINKIHWADGKKRSQLAANEIVINYDSLHSIASSNGGDVDLSTVNQAIAAFGKIPKDVVLGKSVYIDDRYKVDGEKKLKIVGLYTVDRYGGLFVSDELFAEIESYATAPKSLMLTLSNSGSKNDALFEFLADSEVKTGRTIEKLTFYTTVTPIMELMDEMLSVLKTVFMYVAIAFSIFAALMLMNFIGTSINFKKKDIGVLRAIGARGSDVFKIFFNESLVIGIINFVLASIALFVSSTVINSVLGVAVLPFHILPYLLMAGLSLIVVRLATYLPVRKIAGKKPIDAINNR